MRPNPSRSLDTVCAAGITAGLPELIAAIIVLCRIHSGDLLVPIFDISYTYVFVDILIYYYCCCCSLVYN